MAGTPPKPPLPTLAAGSSSSPNPPLPTLALGSSSTPIPPPPTLAAGSSSSPNPPLPTLALGSSSTPNPPPPTLAAGSSSTPKPPRPAFNSHTSYGDLIDSYLRPRIVSRTPADSIHEADLYSADPDLLTSNHAAVTSSNGERAWYFFTPLHPKGSSNSKTQMKRQVETGKKGTWVGYGHPQDVRSNGQVIGHRRSFTFEEKVGGRSAWRMMELRLKPNEGSLNPNPNEAGQEAGYSDLLALCKVYAIGDAQAEHESSMAVANADAEAPAPSAPVMPGREGEKADEEIAAETVASSPGRQKKADGEIKNADAATTEEIFADGGAGKKPDKEKSALGHRVLGKVYRSLQSQAAAAAAAAEADDDDESSDATLDDNYYDVTVAAPSHHSKANDEISGAAPGRKGKALDDETSGAVAPASALKKKTDGSSSAPRAPVSTAEMKCPQCGTDLVLTLKKAESKSETEESTPGAPQQGETPRASSKKRKAGDKDPGAETVASSPGRQNKADGKIESADAATTGEIFADGKDHVDAPEEPTVLRFIDFMGVSSAPLDATDEAEQEEPRDPRDP